MVISATGNITGEGNRECQHPGVGVAGLNAVVREDCIGKVVFPVKI